MTPQEELAIHRAVTELLFERDMREAARRRILKSSLANLGARGADTCVVLTAKGRDYQLTK